MEKYKETFMEFKERTNAKLDKYPALRDLEAQVGVEKFYIALLAVVLLASLLYVMGGASLIVNLVGFIYPAYMSFKAIQTKTTKDDTQWLTYWVVYAFFNLTEQVTDIFLAWIPFYFVIKVAFLIWCYHPATLGANVVYESVLKPHLLPKLSMVDQALKKGEAAMDKAKEMAKKD